MGPRRRLGPNQVIIAGLVLWFGSVESQAGMCLPPPVDVQDPYRYLLTLIDALGWAKSARDTIPQSVPRQGDALSTAIDLMTDIKISDRDYECAASYVKPYEVSKIDGVKLSAQGTNLVFTALVQLDHQVIELYKILLNNAAAGQTLSGTEAEHIAELSARADDIWKTLPISVVAATYSVVVPAEPQKDKLARLTLTEAEREEILKRLRTTFGASIKGGTQETQPVLEVAAATLYKFFGDRQWKCRDTP